MVKRRRSPAHRRADNLYSAKFHKVLIRLEASLYSAVKEKAAAQGVTVTEYIRNLTEENVA